MSTLTDFNSIKLSSFPADQRDQIFAEHLLTLGKVERAKFLTRIIDSFSQLEISALTKTMHSFKQDIEEMMQPATDAALVLEFQRSAYLRNQGLNVFQAIALARTQQRGISLSLEEVKHLTGFLHYQLAELLLPEKPCMGDTQIEVAICESRSLSNQDVRRLADTLGLPPLDYTEPVAVVVPEFVPTQRQRQVYEEVKATGTTGVSVHKMGPFEHQDYRRLTENGYLRRDAPGGVYTYYVDETTKPLPAN